MPEKYPHIHAQTARALLKTASAMRPTSRGIDRHACLIGEYAVLSTGRLKLRNVDTRDDDLRYLDEIIETLWTLHASGIGAVPILGYCCDETDADGCGWMIQQRAAGAELYDDAIMTRFVAWAQNRSDTYISCSLDDAQAMQYLLRRTGEIAAAPQAHFDKFIRDALAILRQDILIDFNASSNFFYDSDVGFQFIDLDAHNDFRYGLADEAPDPEEVVARGGFIPCHLAADTKLFSHIALDEHALSILSDRQLAQLAADNRAIFTKCHAALRKSEIPEAMINHALEQLRFLR